jgi:hypothetical protein
MKIFYFQCFTRKTARSFVIFLCAGALYFLRVCEKSRIFANPKDHKKGHIMSTTALQGLLDYLYGTLSPGNMRWVAEHLVMQADKVEKPDLRPYTMEEVNAMLDEAEADFEAGIGIPDEEVWRELEEEFARMDAEEDARKKHAYIEEEMLVAV